MSRTMCLLALCFIASCTKPKSAEQTEPIRQEASANKTTPSLSSTRNPQPNLIPDKTTEETEEVKQRRFESRFEGPFELSIKGQLDRVEAILYWSGKAARDKTYPEWNGTYLETMDALDAEGPQADDIFAFAVLADENRNITYAHLSKNAARYAGSPWRFRGRILEVEETQNPNLTVARITMDYYGNTPLMVFGRFTTNFVRGNFVDVIGYLAGNYSYKSQAGWDITVPALAALRIVKMNSISKTHTDWTKRIAKGGIEMPPIPFDKHIALYRAIK